MSQPAEFTYPDPTEWVKVSSLEGASYTITAGANTTEPIQWDASYDQAYREAVSAHEQIQTLYLRLTVCAICGEEAPQLVFCDACREVVQEVRRAYFRRLFEEFMAE